MAAGGRDHLGVGECDPECRPALVGLRQAGALRRLRPARHHARALEGAGCWPGLRELWAVVLVPAYGLGIEILQGFTAIRSMEFADWVADTLGAALAVALYLRGARYRKLLEQPIRRRTSFAHERSA